MGRVYSLHPHRRTTQTNYPGHKLKFLAFRGAVTEKCCDDLYGHTFTVGMVKTRESPELPLCIILIATDTLSDVEVKFSEGVSGLLESVAVGIQMIMHLPCRG